MIPQLRNKVLRRLARLLLGSGTFRCHLGEFDANLDPRFLRAASLLRNASDEEAVFVRKLVNDIAPDVPLWVLHETGGKTAGFFVEFGAADGVSLSNTYLLERSYAWRGIVAEPNPVWHAALKRNRTAAIDLRCVFTTTGARVKFAATNSAVLGTIAEFASCDGHAQSRRDHRI